MSRSTRNPPKSRTTTHPHPEASSSSSTNNHNHPDPSSSKKTASDSTPHDEDEDDPFTNLDPSLDTVTLNSLSQAQAQVQAQSQSENDSSLARDDHNHNHDNSHTPNGVLEDFANQALEVSSTSEDRHLLPSSGIRISGIEIGIGSSLGNVDEDVDGEHGDVDTDAANLLAFTNGEDGGLFGSSSSHPGRKPFGELLQAADQGGIGLPGEDGEHHVGVEGDGGVGHVEHDEGQGQENEHDHQHDHGHGHGQGQGDEGLYVDHEGQLLNDAESELDSTALNLARAAVGRSFESRKRKYGEGMENENGDPMDIAKMKKESHKEVERRRRENINEGIEQIARLLPPHEQKTGKGLLLKKAADYLAEMIEKVTRFDEILSKKEEEKHEIQTELTACQARLADENQRSIRYETSWREAEDRAAISQFEVDRLKTELDDVKRKLAVLEG